MFWTYPSLAYDVFQKMKEISVNIAVQSRIRMRSAERESQGPAMLAGTRRRDHCSGIPQRFSVLPCSPTITGLPAAFHVCARLAVSVSDSSSFSFLYQCGEFISIADSLGRSQLVVIGWW